MANETREDKSQTARSDTTRGCTNALAHVNNTRNNGGNEIRPEIIYHTDVSDDAPLDFSTKKYKKHSVLLDQLLAKTTNIVSQEDKSASQNTNINVISGNCSNGSTEMIKSEPTTDITVQPDSVSSPPESSTTNVPTIPGFFPAMSSFPLAFYDPRKGPKSSRPFKGFPRDNISLPLGYYGIPISMPFPLGDGVNPQLLSPSSDDIYAQYRKQILNSQDRPSSKMDNNPISITSDLGHYGQTSTTPSVHSERNSVSGNSSGSSDSEQTIVSNGTTSSRKRSRSLPDERKDEAYWERRRKNNEAAKRSRDARRAKEDEIAIRAAFLEQENLKLRVEVAALKNETAKLRCMLYNS